MPYPWTRRQFVAALSLSAIAPLARSAQRSTSELIVNDVHSRLTPTRIAERLRPESRAELVTQLRSALKAHRGISVAGGRHSMGAQAFGTDTVHLDLTSAKAIGDLDTRSGIIEAEPGAAWPELMRALDERQPGERSPWCIVQKQTGADNLTLGGAIAANIHGRGLRFRPFVQDLESITLLTASGEEIQCSRRENSDWFALAVGGYGLFGVVTSLRLRLMRRQTVRRDVRIATIESVPEQVQRRIDEGCLYGDFQFSTAAETEGFLRDGVFSVYRPAAGAEAAPLRPDGNQTLSVDRWKQLITLAHTDKARAFATYVDYYRTTDGQLYDSDRQQMSTYLPDYHEVVSAALNPQVAQSLVITELYIPRHRLVDFFDDVREDMRRHHVDLVYGVVR